MARGAAPFDRIGRVRVVVVAVEVLTVPALGEADVEAERRAGAGRAGGRIRGARYCSVCGWIYVDEGDVDAE